MTEVEKLEKLLSMGKWPYVLRHGVVAWGFITAVLFSALMFLMNGTFSLKSLAGNLLAFSIGGVFWGLFMWHVLNKRRNKLLQLRESPE